MSSVGAAAEQLAMAESMSGDPMHCSKLSERIKNEMIKQNYDLGIYDLLSRIGVCSC